MLSSLAWFIFSVFIIQATQADYVAHILPELKPVMKINDPVQVNQILFIVIYIYIYIKFI